MSHPAPVLLIGSVPLENSESVFRALATHLGETASRYPPAVLSAILAATDSRCARYRSRTSG